jgi:hypothetical protein
MSEQVYFLSDGGGLIKVGRSGSLKFRIETLQREVGKKLSMIGSLDGGSQLEAEIHRKLKKHRVAGEWFTDCDEVRSTISSYLDGTAETEVVKLPDWISYEPVHIDIIIDPAKLQRNLAMLGLVRAERKAAEAELKAAVSRLEQILLHLGDEGPQRQRIVEVLNSARAELAKELVESTPGNTTARRT